MTRNLTTYRSALVGGLLIGLVATVVLDGQHPPVGQAGQRIGGAQTPTPAPPAGPQRGGGGRPRPAVMTLTTTAWPDGGVIPLKHSQAGDEMSPPLTWSDVPADAASFVLIVTDVDVTSGSAEGLLQWLVWNIPAAARALPAGVPQGPDLADGSRQISATGPNYRGPAATAGGPAHHVLFEIFALDSMIDVPAVGASPAATRTAVLAAMAGKVRGKGALVGLYKR